MKKFIGISIVILMIGTSLSAFGSVNANNFYEHKSIIVEKPYEYYTYNNMTLLLTKLSDDYPQIMSLNSIGTTYEGRDIWMVKLSDDVDSDEDEPEVLLMGAHHGNEKPSYELLIYYIQHIVGNYSKENTDNDGDGLINEDILDGKDNDGDGLYDEDPSEDRVRDVVNNTEIYIIPMVNPDGVEENTRKNCVPNHGGFGFKREITSYGVDINRNYGYKWFIWFLFPNLYGGSTQQFNTGHWGYRGEYPFSEKETQAVRDFVNQHNFKISLSYHSYGEYILYPWDYTTDPPPDEELLISIAEGIKEINNYTIIQGGSWYFVLGSSDDWLYGEKNILAYTIELGTTYAPNNSTKVIDICIKHAGVNLFTCEKSRDL